MGVISIVVLGGLEQGVQQLWLWCPMFLGDHGEVGVFGGGMGLSAAVSM